MKLLKELGRAFFIGSLVFIVIGLIRYFNGVSIPTGKDLLIEFLYNQLYSVALYLSNAYFFEFICKKYKEKIFSFEHLVVGFIGASLITLSILFLLSAFTWTVINGQDFKTFISNQKIAYYYVSFVISIVITAIFYTVFYYRYKQENKVKEQKIIAGTASAQFDALKNQLDPHFLFNSLNVLTSLIEENPQAATRFTTALSKVYRYVLEQKNKELVTVEEELKFAQLYMSLIKMRFEDSIVFSVPGTLSNPEAKVVPLSLQLLLENAVKHNRVTPSKKLHIAITEENGSLVIKNNVQPKKVVKEGSGVGLQNIHRRYYLLTNRRVAIEKNEKEFSVAIPMLTQQISRVVETQEDHLSSKKYERAKKHVEELKGFYIHFSIYSIMVFVFIYLNYISTSFPWALFPIIGWGAGVWGHAMEVFNYNPFLGKNWDEKKIKELMEKDDL